MGDGMAPPPARWYEHPGGGAGVTDRIYRNVDVYDGEVERQLTKLLHFGGNV